MGEKLWLTDMFEISMKHQQLYENYSGWAEEHKTIVTHCCTVRGEKSCGSMIFTQQSLRTDKQECWFEKKKGY